MQAWAGHRPGYYDLVHSHYWLSGHVGWLAAERWGVPLVHAMHTMAKVKNAALADGDTPEPAARVIGETQIVAAADRLIANTAEEADELVRHYDADPAKVAVVHPGVNLDRFRPADGRAAARARLGLPQDALIPLFAGRIQPLKAPDVLLRAVAVLLDERPRRCARGIVVPVVGGPSGSGLAKPEGLQKLAARLGIADVVRFQPPVGQDQLADWFRAASVLVMPSYSESFGLVAIEAQAAGTPVVAAAVGGLPVAVRDGRDRLPGPGPRPGATTRARCAASSTTRRCAARMGAAAARHAAVLRLGHGGRGDGGRLHGRDARTPPSRTLAPWLTLRRGSTAEHCAVAGHRATILEGRRSWSGRARSPAPTSSSSPAPASCRRPARCVVGRHSLSLNAFVIRHPDENDAARPPLAAGAQPPAVRGELRGRPARRHLPRPAGCRCPPSPRRSWTACSARSWRRRTAPSTPCWSWGSRARSARSTRGGCRAASRRATWTRSRI